MHMQGQGQPGMAQMQPGSQMSNLSPNPQNPQGQPGMPGGPQQGNPNMQGQQQGMMQPGPGGQYMMMPAGQMGMQGQMQGQGMQQGQYAPVIFVNPNMPNMGGYQQGGQWMVDPNMQQQMQGMNGQGQQGGC